MGLIRSVTDLLLPRYCKVCGRRLDTGEQHLCISCFLGMPRLEYLPEELSLAERILLTERNVVRAASMLKYEKESDYSKIIYHLKYYNHPSVGSWLAEIGARELRDKGFLDGVEMIIPLPLSSVKQRRRGYNQSAYIAEGISRVIEIPVADGIVTREVSNQKQAGLGRFQRWNNAEGLFSVAQPKFLAGRHVLVVDDVMTTGATLCSLIQTMEKAAPDIRISVFTLAIVE